MNNKLCGVACLSLAITMVSCTKQKPKPEPVGVYVRYECDLSVLGNISNGFGKSQVYFSEVERRDNTLYMLVSDERFSASDAAILFIIDTDKNRVDQIRTRDGKPYQASLKLATVTPDVALGYVHSRLGLVMVQEASQVLAARGSQLTATPSFDFSVDGTVYTSSTALVDVKNFNYKFMSREISREKKTLCTYVGSGH